MIYFSIPILVYLVKLSRYKLEAREGLNSFIHTLYVEFLSNTEFYIFSISLFILDYLQIREASIFLIPLLNLLSKKRYTNELYLITALLILTTHFIGFTFLKATLLLFLSTMIKNRAIKLTFKLYAFIHIFCPLIAMLITLLSSTFEELSPSIANKTLKLTISIMLLALVLVLGVLH